MEDLSHREHSDYENLKSNKVWFKSIYHLIQQCDGMRINSNFDAANKIYNSGTNTESVTFSDWKYLESTYSLLCLHVKVLTTNETVLASAIHCMFYFVHWINDLDFIVPKKLDFLQHCSSRCHTCTWSNYFWKFNFWWKQSRIKLLIVQMIPQVFKNFCIMDFGSPKGSTSRIP